MGHFGRFRVEGREAATLLHHLTTNDIKRLKKGESCDAALVSSKARVLDWLTIARDESGFTVIASPNRRDLFLPHARRFVLFRQDVTLRDVSNEGALLALFGARLPEELQAQTRERGLNVASSKRLPLDGLWLWGEAHTARAFTERLQLPECDGPTFNTLRIESGVPVTGAELTEEHNPWEAGLDESVSLSKGCYNGQEVIARLNTYKKVKQRLCGLRLSAPLELPSEARPRLKANERETGVVTSWTLSPRLGPIALAYLRGAPEDESELVVEHEELEVARASRSALPFSEVRVSTDESRDVT
jgi:folate-binding protein YgfZ